MKHRCGQSPAGPDPVDPRADPVPDESWAEYRLVIRSGEYEFCSEWTRDYDTVIGWDNDSPPDWIVERRGVSATPPQRPVTAGQALEAMVAGLEAEVAALRTQLIERSAEHDRLAQELEDAVEASFL